MRMTTAMNPDDLLYHGTNVPQRIHTDGVLRCAPSGYQCVSLSRSYEVAAYFASLDREYNDPLCGIFAFSRSRLIALGYELVPFHDPIFDEAERDEAEEQIWADIPLNCGALLRIDLLDRQMVEDHLDQVPSLMAPTSERTSECPTMI